MLFWTFKSISIRRAFLAWFKNIYLQIYKAAKKKIGARCPSGNSVLPSHCFITTWTPGTYFFFVMTPRKLGPEARIEYKVLWGPVFLELSYTPYLSGHTNNTPVLCDVGIRFLCFEEDVFLRFRSALFYVFELRTGFVSICMFLWQVPLKGALWNAYMHWIMIFITIFNTPKKKIYTYTHIFNLTFEIPPLSPPPLPPHYTWP